MEAAEGETEVPTVGARRVDCGVTEEQAVRAVSRCIRKLRPRIRVDAGIAQSSAIRSVVASTDIPQRRKGDVVSQAVGTVAIEILGNAVFG